MNNISNNKNIINQKSAESVFLLDKDKYLEGMSKMLQFDLDKELNYVLKLEEKVINVLKDLENRG